MEHHHSILWRLYPKKELTKIYLSLSIRRFALTLIGLFIPLYLHVELGISLQRTLLFFIFYSMMFAVFTPIAAKFAERYGVKHSVLFSIPFYIIFVFLLYLLPTVKLNLMLLGFFSGASLAFYWMGMNLIFYHATDHKHRGEEVGKKLSLGILASLAGPLVGGFLIMQYGFNIVFLLSTILLISSAIILFLSKDEHIKYDFSVKSIVNKKHWQNSLFFVSQGSMVTANQVIWPLFIFSIIGGYFSLGIIGSVLAGVSALLVFLVGKYSDHVDKRKIIRSVAGFEFLSWILKALVFLPWHIYATTILGGLTHGIRMPPLHALEQDKAKGNAAAYFVSREIFMSIGRGLVLVVVLMLDSLSGGLIFQGVIGLVALLF
jgi:MFS family permease